MRKLEKIMNVVLDMLAFSTIYLTILTSDIFADKQPLVLWNMLSTLTAIMTFIASNSLIISPVFRIHTKSFKDLTLAFQCNILISLFFFKFMPESLLLCYIIVLAIGLISAFFVRITFEHNTLPDEDLIFLSLVSMIVSPSIYFIFFALPIIQKMDFTFIRSEIISPLIVLAITTAITKIFNYFKNK
ncbi:hypothetical protein ACYSNR_13955 [Enterococcus sp. LJL128]|uniref:hypothetical protein n=1 Tax=Enterococcus sp. LJL51 TaxID=3416656 RepID=UPI003CE6A5B2